MENQDRVQGLWGDFSSPESKTAILLSNVRDDYYYDQDNRLFIAGFYWGYWYEPYFDRNVMTIDTLAWWYYVGEGPTYEDFQNKVLLYLNLHSLMNFNI